MSPAGPAFRGRLALVGLSVAFLSVGFLLAIGLYGFVAGFLWREVTPDLVRATLLQTLCMFAGFGASTWLFGIRTAGLDGVALRWRPVRARHLVVGLVVGLAPAALALGAGVPLAGAGWVPDGGTLANWAESAVLLLLILAPAALAEEFVFRGVPLVLLAEAFGRGAAIVILAVLFAAAHLLNPGISALGIGNIALAGILLGIAFYLPGGLWTATAVHLGWNGTLALLGAPVSGLPLPVPGLDYQPGGPDWLTGGGFGPEGGLLATLVLTLATLWVASRLSKEQSA